VFDDRHALLDRNHEEYLVDVLQGRLQLPDDAVDEIDIGAGRATLLDRRLVLEVDGELCCVL
jgi:hypothetical protein